MTRVASRTGTRPGTSITSSDPQAEVDAGRASPYPEPDVDPCVGTNLVRPPVAAFLVAPMTLLPQLAADVTFALLGLALLGPRAPGSSA